MITKHAGLPCAAWKPPRSSIPREESALHKSPILAVVRARYRRWGTIQQAGVFVNDSRVVPPGRNQSAPRVPIPEARMVVRGPSPHRAREALAQHLVSTRAMLAPTSIRLGPHPPLGLAQMSRPKGMISKLGTRARLGPSRRRGGARLTAGAAASSPQPCLTAPISRGDTASNWIAHAAPWRVRHPQHGPTSSVGQAPETRP